MLIDLVLNPFDAAVPTILDAATAAESARIDGLWVPDHFSGAVVGAAWSRDPFVVLGAIAASTERVRIGPLVANIRNRSAPQLASAVNSLASLAPGRVVLGMGSGAAPGSRFAVEHEAIGTELGGPSARRALLVEHIHTVRALHCTPTACRCGFDAAQPVSGITIDGRLTVTDGAVCPPIIVGASARSTVDAAVGHADGVNLRAGAQVAELVAAVRRTAGSSFEISVLDRAQVGADRVDEYRRLGVDRLVLGADVGDGAEPIGELLRRLPVG